MQWPIFTEHQPYTSIYPPIALGLFAAAAATGPLYAWWTWKVLGFLTSMVIVYIFFDKSESDPAPLYSGLLFTIDDHRDYSRATHRRLVIVPLLIWLFRRNETPSAQTALVLGVGALIKPTILLGGLSWIRSISRRTIRVGGLLALVLVCTFDASHHRNTGAARG